jgi:hypothetical protein
VNSLGNLHCYYVLLNILGLCISLWELSLSGNLKLDSKGVGSCQERQNTVLLLEREKK